MGTSTRSRPRRSERPDDSAAALPTEGAAPDVGPADELSRLDERLSDERGPRLETSIGWLMAVLGFLIGSRVIADNSFFTHFATGNQILSNGSVPTTDPFSFTAPGEAWTVQSWLASVTYRGLYETLGFWSVRILNGGLTAFITLGLWRLTKPARGLLPRVLLIGSALTVGALMWTPRPLLFGLACMVVLIEVVEFRRPMWWLLPTMWVWVNTHGSFPLALVFLGAVVVGEMLDGNRRPERELRLLGWTIGGIALGAVNPVGPRLLTFPFELLSRREALEDVAEWASPNFSRPSEWAFLGLAFGLVVAAKLGASWRHLLPAFGFFVTGLLAIRNLNPAVLVLVAGVAPALSSVKGSLDGSGRGFPARAIAGVAGAALVALMAVAMVEPALDLDGYPVEEVDWLEARGLVGSGESTLLHRDIVGNYLELRYGRDANVFIDDRYDFFPRSVIDDHATLYFGGDFEAILGRYEPEAVLWESEGLFADWLRSEPSGWTVMLDDDEWLVAVLSQ